MQKEIVISDSINAKNSVDNPNFQEAKFKPSSGYKKWTDFLLRNLNQKVAFDNGINKFIIGPYACGICFTISKEGSIVHRDTYLKRSVQIRIDEEIFKIIKICPNWSSAIQQGAAVEYLHTQMITFNYSDDK